MAENNLNKKTMNPQRNNYGKPNIECASQIKKGKNKHCISDRSKYLPHLHSDPLNICGTHPSDSIDKHKKNITIIDETSSYRKNIDDEELQDQKNSAQRERQCLGNKLTAQLHNNFKPSNLCFLKAYFLALQENDIDSKHDSIEEFEPSAEGFFAPHHAKIKINLGNACNEPLSKETENEIEVISISNNKLDSQDKTQTRIKDKQIKKLFNYEECKYCPICHSDKKFKNEAYRKHLLRSHKIRICWTCKTLTPINEFHKRLCIDCVSKKKAQQQETPL